MVIVLFELDWRMEQKLYSHTCRLTSGDWRVLTHLHMDLRRKEGGETLRKDNRDQVLVMRMTKEEKERLREIANEEGCTISKIY